MGVISGYRVLDLADEKGMFCGRLLAGMGSEVIRVEKPGVHYNISDSDYLYLNSGKRRVTLDIRDEQGKELFRRLIKTADVVVETETPGYLTSLSLGYHDLEGINPRLVMASITHFGQTGPYRDCQASDLVVEAMGGWMSVTGDSDMPLKLPGNQAYYNASLFAANGIMLALWDRYTSDKGQHLDISIMDCVAATLDHVLVRYYYEDIISERQGGFHWNNAFRVFRCRDGYILLSLFHQWDTLVELLESEGMAGDLTQEKWRDRVERDKGIDYIIEILGKWTLTHNIDELVEKGQLMHFPWAKVTSIPELIDSDQLSAKGYLSEIEYNGRKYKTAGAPVKMSGMPWLAGGVFTEAGGDNNTVFRSLGLSTEDIKSLAGKGII